MTSQPSVARPLYPVPALLRSSPPPPPRSATRSRRVDPTDGRRQARLAGGVRSPMSAARLGPTGMLYVANQGPIGPSRGRGIYVRARPSTPPVSIASGTHPTAVGPSAARCTRLTAIASIHRRYDRRRADRHLSRALRYVRVYRRSAPSRRHALHDGVVVVRIGEGRRGLRHRGRHDDRRADAGEVVRPPTRSAASRPRPAAAESPCGRTAEAVELDPQSGAVTTPSSGGLLKTPQGLARDAAGDVLDPTRPAATRPARAASIAPTRRRPLAARPASPSAPRRSLRQRGRRAAELVATAARRQQLGASGLPHGRPNRACTVGYSAKVSGFTSPLYEVHGFGVQARRTSASCCRGRCAGRSRPRSGTARRSRRRSWLTRRIRAAACRQAHHAPIRIV